MNKIKKLLLFTVIMTLVAWAYVLLAPHQVALPEGSWRQGVGEMAGGALAWLFVIIYGRTLLKIMLRNGPLLERLMPEGRSDITLPLVHQVMKLLNQTHPYIGATAVILVFAHALLEGFSRANLLMEVIFFLVLWQFGFGLFLLSRYQAIFIKKMKRYGYLAHSQLYTGIAIGVSALFGHLLVGR